MLRAHTKNMEIEESKKPADPNIINPLAMDKSKL